MKYIYSTKMEGIEFTCTAKTKDESRDIVITETIKAASHDEAAELGYQDFEVNLFINHKFITDLSPVLDQTPVFTDMIDSVDWVSVYQEQMEAKKEYNETEY